MSRIKKRVFITAMSAVSPIGTGIDEFFDGIRARRRGIDRIRCFPTDNYPVTLGAEARRHGKVIESNSDEDRRELRWFQRMWLSNGDFVRAVTAALRADAESWPAPAVVVNAVSANDRTPWDLTGAARLIGLLPKR